MNKRFQAGVLCLLISPVLSPVAVSGSIDYEISLRLEGTSWRDRFGSVLAAPLDANSDGYPDIAVGIRGDNTAGGGFGSVRIYSTRDGSEVVSVLGQTSYGYFGAALSVVGDIDRDGVDDYVAGAFGSSGTATVHSGSTGSVIYELSHGRSRRSFGASVSSAGDVNADGFPDIVVGDPHVYGGGVLLAGEATVFSGADGSELFAIAGGREWRRLGFAVASAGDVDRDGHADLIVGGQQDSTRGSNAGYARVVSGATSQPLFEFFGTMPGDGLGTTVGAAGDVNRDGYPDIYLGIPGDDTAGRDSGAVQLLSGQDGTLIRSIVNENLTRNKFGYAVAALDDVDGDGLNDLLISSSATVGIYSVADGRLIFETSSNEDTFGFALANVGDVNRDGLSDFVVGGGFNEYGYAVLFTSVPEASTSVLAAIGISLALTFTQRDESLIVNRRDI